MSALQNLPSNISYLSPIGFRFILSNFPEVTYFCQAANIPGVSIGGIDFPTPLKNIQFSGDEVTFEELSIRFVVDENLKNWLSIYDWIIGMGIPDKESAEKYKKLKDENRLVADGTLAVLTSNMNVQMEVQFQNMFPLSLSGISFDSSAADVDYVVSDVTFQYDIYKITNFLQNESSYEGAPVYTT
tara:strand:- start:823 stop:1380 length:558 start_codon:yes stop_codon:yes gene_type:complete